MVDGRSGRVRSGVFILLRANVKPKGNVEPSLASCRELSHTLRPTKVLEGRPYIAVVRGCHPPKDALETPTETGQETDERCAGRESVGFCSRQS